MAIHSIFLSILTKNVFSFFHIIMVSVLGNKAYFDLYDIPLSSDSKPIIYRLFHALFWKLCS